MDIQRLRNLTTGKLHTDISCIYEDIGHITGLRGLMTHQVPNAMRAMKPYLKEKIKDERFWDDKYDPTHVGDVAMPVMDKQERSAMLERFEQLPDPLFGKHIIQVTV